MLRAAVQEHQKQIDELKKELAEMRVSRGQASY
jgi:ribosomal protein L29